MACNAANCKDANDKKRQITGAPYRLQICMYVLKYERMRDIKRTAAPHNSPFPPTIKTKQLRTRTQPSTEISICAHDTFCFRPLSCGGHFDLYPTPSLLRSFGKRRDVTIWKKPRASERRSCPPPPADTAPGLTGSARPAQSPTHQKHNIPYPRFIIT